MPQPEGEDRPAGNRAASLTSTTKTKIPNRVAESNGPAVALRCAWLRVHAEDVRVFDPSGQLSAQPRDFADLLEVAERERWLA